MIDGEMIGTRKLNSINYSSDTFGMCGIETE